MREYIAVIGIGSNIDAEQNVKMALNYLADVVRVLKVSDFVKTKPLGIKNQQWFTNGAARVQSRLNQSDLNKQLKQIEDKMGRDRTRPKYGPREIDLDIVVFDNKIIDEDYHQRDFLKKAVDQVWSAMK